MKVIVAGQTVYAGLLQPSEVHAVAAVCCCRWLSCWHSSVKSQGRAYPGGGGLNRAAATSGIITLMSNATSKFRSRLASQPVC
jgi:hypothetical protein